MPLQGDTHTAQGTPGGNIAAHHTGTDHVNVFCLKAAAGFAKALEPLLQEENTDKIARRA